MKHFASTTQIQIALGMAALGLGVALAACSSSSTSGGTDAGTSSDASKSGDSGGQSGDAGGGCVPVGASGNSLGVGKYCTTEEPCVGLKANFCAVIGGDPKEDFCTFQCTPPDGGADPCGDNASCACDPSNPSQCGCTPLSCQ